MTARNERKDEGPSEAEEKSPREVPREHAGNKPRLTDEQAHAELRRRQRERGR